MGWRAPVALREGHTAGQALLFNPQGQDNVRLKASLRSFCSPRRALNMHHSDQQQAAGKHNTWQRGGQRGAEQGEEGVARPAPSVNAAELSDESPAGLLFCSASLCVWEAPPCVSSPPVAQIPAPAARSPALGGLRASSSGSPSFAGVNRALGCGARVRAGDRQTERRVTSLTMTPPKADVY